MSEITETQINQIESIRIKVDKKQGNHNGRIDGDEVSIFGEELEKAGFKDAKNIIDSYLTDKLSFENEYFVKNTKSKENVNNFIIAQINPDSFLVSNQKVNGDGEDIADKIDDACSEWYGTNLTNLGEAIDRINENNVLQVINKYEEKYEPFAKMLDSDLNQSELDKYGKPIIEALVTAADKMFIDITSIVSMDKDENYIVGTGLAGANAGESATDSDNFEKVVNALKAKIEDTSKLITDNDSAKNDVQGTMYALARQADGMGNGNGVLENEEIGWFKSACAKLGISINSMLISIKDKLENKNNLSADEEYLHNIFASTPEESFIKANEAQNTLSSITGNITSAINQENAELLDGAITGVHKGNVLDVLDALETDDKFMKISYLKYNNSAKCFQEKNDGFDIAAKMYDKCDSDAADKAVKQVINALYELAEENHIDVSGIVKKTQNGFTDKNGKNVINKENADKVIDALRTKLKACLSDEEVEDPPKSEPEGESNK